MTVPICNVTTRYQSMMHAIFLRPPALLVVSISELVLTPFAVLAGVLGAWRLGADPGWTSDFFIADGLLSHYQLWFAIAIGAQTSAFVLNRWVADESILTGDWHLGRVSGSASLHLGEAADRGRILPQDKIDKPLLKAA